VKRQTEKLKQQKMIERLDSKKQRNKQLGMLKQQTEKQQTKEP
jgi:hypothetical protein